MTDAAGMSGTVFAINPAVQVRPTPLFDGHVALVADDLFADPVQVRDYAMRHAAGFVDNSANAYPGLELELPLDVMEDVRRWWRYAGRPVFGMSRTLSAMGARFSMATLPPEKLHIGQRLCHIDRPPGDVPPGHRVIAGVVYLFADTGLGGTSFFRMRSGVDIRDIRRRYAEGDQQALAETYAFFRQKPTYPVDSNDFFEWQCTLPANYNRAVFYPADIFHSGDIRFPEKLSTDLSTGRLTINVFFCGPCFS